LNMSYHPKHNSPNQLLIAYFIGETSGRKRFGRVCAAEEAT
jgi:hypothetical protein